MTGTFCHFVFQCRIRSGHVVSAICPGDVTGRVYARGLGESRKGTKQDGCPVSTHPVNTESIARFSETFSAQLGSPFRSITHYL